MACKVNKNRKLILNDNNPHLVLFLKELINDKIEFPSEDVSQEWMEEEYIKFKGMARSGGHHPLIAFWGFGMSFGGKWFGGLARGTYSGVKLSLYNVRRNIASCTRIRDSLRMFRDVEITCGNYRDMKIRNKSVVYADPPYVNRTKAYYLSVDSGDVWDWIREISDKNIVLATEFVIPDDFMVLHDFGDTVVRHYASRGSDGTSEVLCCHESLFEE